MAKYGIENFIFEVIAMCNLQLEADETESILIQQYNSRDKQFGYNSKIGGVRGTHSEETKQKMSESMFKQIATLGHPAQGTKRTPEQIQKLIQARKDYPVDYTTEKRQRMSEAHIGIKDSEETKLNKSKSAKEAWIKRANYDGIKCHVTDCNISGKNKYKIIDNIRYCNKHGLRMLRYGRIERVR